MAQQPIWKDYFANLGAVASMDITIRVRGNQVFAGKAIRKPSDSDLLVYLNDIVADYLSATMPPLDAQTFVGDSGMTALAQVYNGRNLVDTISFSYDYSYQDARPMEAFATTPEDKTIDRRQPLILSIYPGSEVINYRMYTTGGGTTTHQEEIGQSGAIVVPSSALANVSRVVFSAPGTSEIVTFRIVDTCARYALYFVNPFGGWDSVTMEGEHLQTNEVTREQMTRAYNSANAMERGKDIIVNTITPKMVLRSGWIAEAQADKFVQLVQSPNVYLYDMQEAQMIPVVVTDNTATRKTHKSLGGKLISYDVNVEFAQNKFIR